MMQHAANNENGLVMRSALWRELLAAGVSGNAAKGGQAPLQKAEGAQ